MAEVHGNLPTDWQKLIFDWSISNGLITTGQGTPVIEFETNAESGEVVQLTIKVGGLDNWPEACAKEVSITIDPCKERKKSGHT